MAEEVVQSGLGEVQDGSQVSGAEERARRMGWLPKEDFKGAAERWVPAEEYVARAEREMPVLKGTLGTMERKMAEQSETITQQNQMIAQMRTDFKDFVEFSKKSEERSYKKALKELQAKQRAAVAEGDLTGFDQATAEIDQMIQDHPAVTGKEVVGGGNGTGVPAQEPAGGGDGWFSQGALDEWMDKEPWFLENPKMAQFANQMDQWLTQTSKRRGKKMSHREHLAEISRLVREEFPEAFGNQAKKKVSSVESGGAEVPVKSGKKGYADLPPEVKAVCDRYTGKDGAGKTGTIPGLTRDEYVREYFAGEE